VELAEICDCLRRHRGVVVIIVLMAVAAGVASGYRIVGFPPTVEARALPLGMATKQLYVDAPQSALGRLDVDAGPMIARTGTLTQVIDSEQIRVETARLSHIPVHDLTVEGPFSGPPSINNVVTPSEARAHQVIAERTPYRLTSLVHTDLPVVTLFVQAPSPEAAAAVAENAYRALQRYLASLERPLAAKPLHQLVVRSMGPPAAGSVHGGIGKAVTVFAFLATLIIGLLLLLSASGVRRRIRGGTATPRARQLA
jgi:hypothetical protein